MTEPKQLDVERRWPDLFMGLDEEQRRSVVQPFAAAWHAGWEPNREDVANLTDYAAGRIDHAEYVRRADAAASRTRGSEE